jgi:hypothetical protein
MTKEKRLVGRARYELREISMTKRIKVVYRPKTTALRDFSG